MWMMVLPPAPLPCAKMCSGYCESFESFEAAEEEDGKQAIAFFEDPERYGTEKEVQVTGNVDAVGGRKRRRRITACLKTEKEEG